MSATYTDSRGRQHRLTRAQWHYLEAARQYGHVAYGWGGYRSTLTARLLRERGLLDVSEHHHAAVPWCITGITPLGQQILEASAPA